MLRLLFINQETKHIINTMFVIVTLFCLFLGFNIFGVDGFVIEMKLIQQRKETQKVTTILQNTRQLVHTEFNMLPRNVTVNRVQWNPDGMNAEYDVPLQHYHSKVKIPPAIRHTIEPMNKIQRLITNLNTMSSVKDAIKDYENDNNSLDLSISAKNLLYEWDKLTILSKQQLEQKLYAEARSSAPISVNEHLHVLYYDEHICVVHKPSGILAVPGPRRNPSITELVYNHLPHSVRNMDQMVVHRIDMDTSGILILALSEYALKQLHTDFRERNVKKYYQALLTGHVPYCDIEIDIDLERDPNNSPFMRITQPKNNDNNDESDNSIQITTTTKTTTKEQGGGRRKFLDKAPKPSLTELHVLEWCTYNNTTRVELIPHTGRTHQLRVHTSAIGYPIVGDDIYNYKYKCNNININNDEILTKKECLCLHAYKITLLHPISRAPMIFECDSYF